MLVEVDLLREDLNVSDLFEGLKQKISGRELKIVFPEGLDERILKAAGRLAEEKLLTPILIGNIEQIQAKSTLR